MRTTIDNGDGTYTHTVDVATISLTALLPMAGTYQARRRRVPARVQIARQWTTRANDGRWIRRERVIAGDRSRR